MINLFKAYIGISFLTIPEGFTRVGLYGGIATLTIILLLNYYSTWLLIKARNKFKHKKIA